MVWERLPAVVQRVIDQGPRAKQYYSDQWPIYQLLVYYPAKYEVSEGKADTYSVEAINAELRHYLARLARRSRCFSRCIQALWLAIKLFVFCHNHRQLYHLAYPTYPRHLFEFVSPLC